MWGLDFMCHFWPLFGFKYVMVAVDYISKCIEVKVTCHDDFKHVVNFLQTNIFCSHGLPKALISDKGSQFCK